MAGSNQFVDARMPRQRRAGVDVPQADSGRPRSSWAPPRAAPIGAARRTAASPAPPPLARAPRRPRSRLQHERAARRERSADDHGEVARPEEAVRGPAADVVLDDPSGAGSATLDAHAPCGLRMPLGLLVEPDEKNSTPASLGATAAPVASTSSPAVARRRREVVPGSIAPPARAPGDRDDEPPQEREPRRLQRTRVAVRDPRLELGQDRGEVLLRDASLEEQHRDARGLQQVVELGRRRERAERRRPRHRRAPCRTRPRSTRGGSSSGRRRGCPCRRRSASARATSTALPRAPRTSSARRVRRAGRTSASRSAKRAVTSAGSRAASAPRGPARRRAADAGNHQAVGPAWPAPSRRHGYTEAARPRRCSRPARRRPGW